MTAAALKSGIIPFGYLRDTYFFEFFFRINMISRNSDSNADAIRPISIIIKVRKEAARASYVMVSFMVIKPMKLLVSPVFRDVMELSIRKVKNTVPFYKIIKVPTTVFGSLFIRKYN